MHVVSQHTDVKSGFALNYETHVQYGLYMDPYNIGYPAEYSIMYSALFFRMMKGY